MDEPSSSEVAAAAAGAFENVEEDESEAAKVSDEAKAEGCSPHHLAVAAPEETSITGDTTCSGADQEEGNSESERKEEQQNIDPFDAGAKAIDHHAQPPIEDLSMPNLEPSVSALTCVSTASLFRGPLYPSATGLAESTKSLESDLMEASKEEDSSESTRGNNAAVGKPSSTFSNAAALGNDKQAAIRSSMEDKKLPPNPGQPKTCNVKRQARPNHDTKIPPQDSQPRSIGDNDFIKEIAPLPLPLENPTPSQQLGPGAFMGAPGQDLRATQKVMFSLVGTITRDICRADTSPSTASPLPLDQCSNHTVATHCSGHTLGTHYSNHTTGTSTFNPADIETSTMDLEAQAPTTHTIPSIDPSPSGAFGNGHSGLVVASEVMGESSRQQDMPHAEEVPETVKEEDEPKKRWAGFTPLAGVLFVAGIVLLLVFLLSKGEADEPMAVQPNDPSPSSSSLEEHILSLLPEHTLDSLNQQDSPQSTAFKWILADPSLQTYSQQRIIQRYALATLFFSTKGHNWYNQTNWISYTHHECQWFRTNLARYSLDNGDLTRIPNASSYYKALDESPTCDEETQAYQHLWLLQNGLQGELPLEVYLLDSLKTLFLGFNTLAGSTLSPMIGNLSSLQALVIMESGFGGSIPTELGYLTNLDTIYFAANDFSGTVPTELSRLSGSLLELDLSENLAIRGTLPTEFGLLENVRTLHFWQARLTGPIPSELGQLERLNFLNFGWGQLEGTLPTELGLCRQLSEVFLDKNHLTGTLPSEIGSMDALQELWLHGNSLSGTLPAELARLAENRSLVAITLEGNQISGTIPQSLCTIGGEEVTTCSLYPYFNCSLGFDCSDSLCGCDCSCSGSAA